MGCLMRCITLSAFANPIALTLNTTSHTIFQKEGDYAGREAREGKKEVFPANLRALRSHLFPVRLFLKDGLRPLRNAPLLGLPGGFTTDDTDSADGFQKKPTHP